MSGSERLIAEARSLAATRAGLPPEWASRLGGSTLAEVEADALAFRESLDALRGPATPPARNLSGGVIRQDSATWTLDSARALARSNPDRFNKLVDSGEIDPTELARRAR